MKTGHGRNGFSFPSCLHPLLGGMLSQIAMGGYEKLLLTNLVECTVRSGLQIDRIEARCGGYYLAMGWCYFTGADQP